MSDITQLPTDSDCFNHQKIEGSFDLIGERYTMDYAFETVRSEIHQLTGKRIGREIVKAFI
ncbi:hypothetical protein RhiirA5_413406 [Rhizophagus irregularis]|uniref:Uncharacterized protein n=1 Tax=Rhizophagus irregularis TaxID=588596 RepID=A0A2I1DTJ8_9GLOM|nr:hypothetical protein RhiirA5_413406 [Rhizophagus irregularis]PKC75913.1 hypothetical protein RhiirA1_448213 [Rhizophagus irregularis]PKY13201.1 hypothetical protein RhiirB3_424971 [Rhizophagus irregularis]